ncbi:MAG: phenylalanine--tRNA ligase subunit beta [Candidatus Bipolaricaulia bacterium]
MRVPLSWLTEYVDVTLPVAELAHRLTMAGIEVAAVEHIGRHPETGKENATELTWDGVYVGKIVEVNPHPNADRLVVATVDYGDGRRAVSVTGAPNVRIGEVGNKVPVAEVGATLVDPYADRFQTFTVAAARIRGVDSKVVIPSEKELGLSDDHTGILILDDDIPVGAPLSQVTGDVVLEFDLTPNLARCLSVIGVAREVATLTGERLKLEDPNWVTGEDSISGQAAIEIADPDLCSRYTASLIRGIQVQPSPFWMRRRLLAAGMRPINNIVDITNYCMLEWGQPLHAFDYDRLRAKPGESHPTIIVRRAKPDERLTTLDGVERRFIEADLFITDGGGPIAIAGVMGGLETEVTEATENVLLESANFEYISNRRTANRLKISSEASDRFGKGMPAELTIPALVRASGLMRQLASGTIADGIIDVYPVKQPLRQIELDPGEVERILGMKVSPERIITVLKSLEFQCESEPDRDVIQVTVPDHRLDVEIPADLIEEVARVIGYDQIPTTLMYDTLPPQRRNRALEGEEWVRDLLTGIGLMEVISYSLTYPEGVARFDPVMANEAHIALANPLTQERSHLRRTLIVSLIETVKSNLRFGDRVAIFEIGRVYLPVAGELLPEEPRRLGIALSGPRSPRRSWSEDGSREMDFFDLKGVVDTLLDRLGLQDTRYRFASTTTNHRGFHPGRSAELEIDGKRIGILGELHPEVAERFDLPEVRICVGEFDLDALLDRTERDHPYQPISRYPAVIQDLAVIVDETIPARQVYDLIREAGGELVTQAVLFDVYRGEQIPEGKVSLAYTLTYQTTDRTLTDDEVQQVHERIRRHLEQELGAKLRA